MSFDDVTKSLAETFGGQASLQADTFSGKMARMQVAFDEAKESVGARLLPILTQLLDAFNTKVGPAVQAIQDKLKPLTKAIDDNKEEFTALWNFLNKYIVPIMTGALKSAFSGIVTGITAVVNIVGKAVNFFKDLYDAYKKFVDFIKNNPLSKFLGKFNPFSNSSFTTSNFDNPFFAEEEFPFAPKIDRSKFGSPSFANANFVTGAASGEGFDAEGDVVTSPGLGTRSIAGLTEAQKAAVRRSIELQKKTAEIRARIAARNSGSSSDISTNGNPVVINVNAASIIDSEGFTRAVIQALNESQSRTGSLDTLQI
jgi:hypothetical protein